MNKWIPTTNISELRVLGKAAEESSELSTVLARCIIQGINESEPVTGKPNRRWLEEEIADVMATLSVVMEEFDLDHDFIIERTIVKVGRLEIWKELLKDDTNGK